jgi:hypothetical protein
VGDVSSLATSRQARDRAATMALQAAAEAPARRQPPRTPTAADKHKRATWRAMRRVALAHQAEFLHAYGEERNALEAQQ